MSTWNRDNTVITDLGYQLLSKIQIGKSSIILSRVVAGKGRVANNLLHSQTEVSEVQKTATITGRSDTVQGSVVEVQFSNVDTPLESGFSVNQIGIYASHPDMGEVLYMLAQCDEGTADTMPRSADTLMTLNYSFDIVHGNNATLEVTVTGTGILTVSSDLKDIVVTHITSSRILPVSGETLGITIGKITKWLQDIESGKLDADNIITLTGTGSAMIMNRTNAQVFDGIYLLAKMPYEMLDNATLRTSDGSPMPVVYSSGLNVKAGIVVGAFVGFIFNSTINKWFIFGVGKDGSSSFDDLYAAFIAHINNTSIHVKKTVVPVTLAKASWINEVATKGYYRYRVSNALIFAASCTVDVDFDNANRLLADNSSFDGSTTEGDGYVDLYSYSLPASDISAKLLIYKG